MAIVEDEVRNESEEENDIEVVVEEYDAEQDSEDSDDDDEALDSALESKVEELELRIKDDPYNYDEHIELIQTLWGLSDLDRWRLAFERMQQLMALKPDHWLMRLQTEATISHTSENRDAIAELFHQALLDGYSNQILSEWCSWSLSVNDPTFTRAQLEEVLRRAGADPLSGKVFWDAKMEFEKAQMDNMSEDDEKYKQQRERILFCLEEIVSRPLLRAEDAWESMLELGKLVHGEEYIDKVTKQHEAAMEYLQKITPFEDKLLTTENIEEKFKVYEEYAETIKDLAKNDKYKECDSDGILKVIYERGSSECATASGSGAMLAALAKHVRATASRHSYWRVLHAAVRRAPRRHTYWTAQMLQAEHEERPFDEVKTIFETALGKGMESYKHSERLWFSYLEYLRRNTDFNNEKQVDLIRSTFRLAWDSLAEVWGEEANDCEVPLFWARLEYKRMNDPKRGKEIFEEIFKYGENKTMSKYWEALLQLEMSRSPPPAEHKLRDLFRRALRAVTDYPPALVRLWTDTERDCGPLHALTECYDTCEAKLKEWRENYQAMKDKMTGKKQKPTKQNDNKKGKFDKKKKQEDKPKNKGKRKAEPSEEGGGVKRKRDEDSEVVTKDKDSESKGTKRSHDEEEVDQDKDKKRARRDSSEARPAAREACTLFVSNLEFKVNEQNLRDKLSQFGDIVSLRVKSGVKAFGGSICYCQYKTQESVDEAIKHDRTLLDGRPMFLSRYSAKKGKPQFKYATSTEKNKLFVKNLPYDHCNKESLTEIFDKYGNLNDVRAVTFKDGKPKGLAYIEYSDEESAARALAATHGLSVGGRALDVALSAPPRRDTEPTALGSMKREPTAGMRRTQLSSFTPSVLQKKALIPSVLQHASTSKPTNGHNLEKENGSDGTSSLDQPTTSGARQPMTNNDFRSMLLGQK